MKALRAAGFVLALAFLAMTFVNASWLADTPRGYVKLVALEGAHQLGRGPCPAARIEPPLHDYLGNTLGGMAAAGRLGAQMVGVELQPARDGHLVALADEPLDCRTNGHGRVGDRTLAEVKALDAGHGYSTDRGRTFPFRGRAVGAVPAFEEVLQVLPDKPLLIDLPGDARAALQVVATYRAMGRDPVKVGDGFRGTGVDLAPIRKAFAGVWAWDPAAAEKCRADYLWQGWLGITPASCREATLTVPLGRRWMFAGWPNRLQARMAAANARVVVETSPDKGLDLPEQLGEVPASFTGYVLVEDIWTVGPALRPAYNRRTPLQEEALVRALEARRQR